MPIGNLVGRGALIATMLFGSAGAAAADAILFSSSPAAHAVFVDRDGHVRVIDGYGGSGSLPSGLEKREVLPSGLRNQLDERGALPPGLQKRLEEILLTDEPTFVSETGGAEPLIWLTIDPTGDDGHSPASDFGFNSGQNHSSVPGLQTHVGRGGTHPPETQDATIPEPSLLLLMGMGALGTWRRLSRQKLIAARP